MIYDESTHARMKVRDNPVISAPQNIDQLIDMLTAMQAGKRTNLVIRVNTGPTGVAVGGKAMPNLPGSMVQILSANKKTGTQPVGSSISAKQPTDWVVQGTEAVRFTVTRNNKVQKSDVK